jgi:tryptophan synthase alpha chain
MANTQVKQTGLEAITQAFTQARNENRAAFLPFFTVGYPDYETSLDVLETLAKSGADAIEVGVPFSDPLAEGPTIQHSSQIALENRTTVKQCVQAIKTLRERGVTIPLVLMGYINPMLAYGLEQLAHDAADAGANGFIVPDLPPDEAGELVGYCEKYGLALVPLLAPTSTPDRIRQATSRACGFVYLVAVTGVTGARDTLPPDLVDYVRRVRSLTTQPIAVGFGISQPEHARNVSAIADGIAVGSALVRLMESGGVAAIRDLAVKLRAACAEKSS